MSIDASPIVRTPCIIITPTVWRIDVTNAGNRAAVYLMANRTELSEDHEDGFDGVVAKTFVSALLLKEVQRTVGVDSWRSTLLPVLEKELAGGSP